jgi:hypothetical protein
VKVLGEQDDGGSGVGSADADVVELAVDPQGDGAGVVDLVVADAVVGVGGPVGGWCGFRACCVGGRGGGVVGQGPVGAPAVVLVLEPVEQGL